MRDGKDRAGAELYLHVDLPMKDGAPVRAGLAEWHDRFIAALGLPGLLTRFLESVGLTTSGDPAARFAVQIQARTLATAGLDEIVDFGDLAVLSPRKYSMQFDGWAVADKQGKAAGAISRRFLTELCESTGRTGYEGILADLPGAEPQRADGQPNRSRKGSRAARIGGLCAIAAVVIAAVLIGFWVSSPSRPAAPFPLTALVHANIPVTPTGGGQSTGVQVRLGQKVRISAAGLIVYGYELVNCPGYPCTDPAGNRTSSITGQPCGEKFDSNAAIPAPRSPVGSLLWRVGDSGWFEAGTSSVITAPENGILYLGVNDDTPQDNTGFFTVTLTNAP